ncbi:hypothetical protein [Arthrobacter sp. SO3]|uniref:hypothetical protein n=1 Tax=Arthrobacter sp. SO3 TaxID=1897057 RepID=UPI001CFFF82D|nr:hypothetical protein [Arthrobacter sp. SO3]MCB5292021.1 hypothetical protein [Arthrobacter sp. SO3]
MAASSRGRPRTGQTGVPAHGGADLKVSADLDRAAGARVAIAADWARNAVTTAARTTSPKTVTGVAFRGRRV